MMLDVIEEKMKENKCLKTNIYEKYFGIFGSVEVYVTIIEVATKLFIVGFLFNIVWISKFFCVIISINL